MSQPPTATASFSTRTGPGTWSGTLGKASLKAFQTLLLLALFGVLVYALVQISLVVIPLLLALILAAAIAPFVLWLRRKGWSSPAATAFSFLLLLVLTGGVLTAVVFAVMGQVDTLVSSAAGGADRILTYLQDGPLPIDNAQLEEARKAAVDFATSSAAGTTALSGLSTAAHFLTGMLLMVVILFFFLRDGEKMFAFLLRPFRGTRLVKARSVGNQAVTILGGYVRGTAVVAAVDTLFIGAALLVLGVPLAVPLAAVVFIGAFIPLVGATLAGALATLVALVTNGPTTALIVVAVVILVNQLEGNFLQPVVMGHTLSVHPLVVLVALTAGTSLAGIIGAILAVPLTAAAWAGLKAWNAESDEEISKGQILQAENHTLMDEQGRGPSTTSGNAPETASPLSPADIAALKNRPSTVARTEISETGDDGTGDQAKDQHPGAG